jgi:hypothetical protein
VIDKHRAEFNLLLKKHANFFKHGNRPEEETIEFPTVTSDLFVIFSIIGLSTCRVPQTDYEAAFLTWIQVHNPDFLTDQGRKMLTETLSVEALQEIRLLSKEEFLQVVLTAKARTRQEANTLGALRESGIR